MDIDLSEDLQYYKESFVLGLTVKQAIFSFLALGVGTGIVLLLYKKIGITLSCYVATPFVVPLALTGFYNYHGLTFWQFASRLLYYSFFNRPLVYHVVRGRIKAVISGRETGTEIKTGKGRERRKKEKEGGCAYGKKKSNPYRGCGYRTVCCRSSGSSMV